jgi:uncharacterized protein (TIGR00369 family)
MPGFEPRDDKFEERLRASFLKQRVMETIGARLVSVTPGRVEIELEYREDLTQQDGYLHGAITTSIVDSACGYAAHSLMPADSDVLTVEYKVNFVTPARGSKFIATGQVVKAGRTLTLCAGEVVAEQDGNRVLVAVMQATMIRLERKS